MRLSTRYGSHLPVLMQVMPRTSGDVLELGMGVFSTPFLHYACTLSKRKLVSYDNDDGKYTGWMNRRYSNDYHTIIHIPEDPKEWEKIDIDKPWDVALVDVTPDYMRKELIKKLVNNTNYVLIHDANPRWEKVYHYSEIYPLFKYKTFWTRDDTHTGVLSNFIDVTHLFDKYAE